VRLQTDSLGPYIPGSQAGLNLTVGVPSDFFLGGGGPMNHTASWISTIDKYGGGDIPGREGGCQDAACDRPVPVEAAQGS